MTSVGSGHPDAGRHGIMGPPATPEERRFAQVYAADRVGPMPYPNQASPDVAAARGRVRALVDELLPHGVDEGTGAALDPLIASWTSGWLARIDSEHTDHQAVIDRLVGGARQQLAEAEASHERDRRALEIARRDYDAAREALISVPAADDSGSEPAGWSTTGRSGGASTENRGAGSRGGILGRVTRRGSSGRRGTGGAGEDDGPAGVDAPSPDDRTRSRDTGDRTRSPHDTGDHARSPHDTGDRTRSPHDTGDHARSPHDTGPPEPATRPVPIHRPSTGTEIR